MRKNGTHIIAEILLALSRGPVRLWRNNVGSYKTDAGHFVKYGIQNPGGSDTIGLTQIIVTPSMVGKKVAIFTAIEIKAQGDKLTDHQKTFLEFIHNAGGISGVASTVEDARAILAGGIGV